MNVDEKGIMEMLGQKIKEYEQKISSFRDAMKALVTGGNGGISLIAAPAKRRRRRGRKPQIIVKRGPAKAAKATKATGARRGRKPRSGETMEGWLLKQLSDGKPKTNRMLMDIYNKTMGKKLDANGFSARLAMIKKRGNIKSAKNNEDGLLYNGKAEWFDTGGKLKKEYR